MRVAFVSMHTDLHRSDGATRRTRRTAELLAARGHEVVVLCAQWWDGPVAEFDRDGVAYRAVTGAPAAGTFASKVPFALRRVAPDVVQVVNSPPSHVVAATTAARLLRVPVVVDWWCDVPGDSRAGYRRAARGADAVLAPSRMVRTQVREHGGPGVDVDVVPEPVDMSMVREAPVDSRADILYARDLDSDANVGSFLLALAELRDREWRAAVVGDGPARGDAERMARDLRIDDRVAFLGDLPVEEVVPVMKGARVFAQTATREPFATNLLWALACGCVGIVEYQAESSAHELVEKRTRGVRVTSPQELADEIISAARVDPMTVNEEFQEFDRGTVIEQYLSVYRTAAAERGLL
ncbi:MAG: glycosyltransferase family 4 protein [Salinigranum sp.]